MKSKKPGSLKFNEYYKYGILVLMPMLIMVFFIECDTAVVSSPYDSSEAHDSIGNSAFFYKSSFYERPFTSADRSILRKGLPNGITLGMHSKDYFFDYGDMISEIKHTGAKWICIQFNIYQEGGYSSDNFDFSKDNELYWKQLIKVLSQCRKLDMKVMVNPIVLLNNDEGQKWRGQIYPDDINKWFSNYTSILLKMALLCQEYNVSAMGVGSEFCLLEHQTEKWTTLILEVRRRFNGLLTYSLNWDQLHVMKFYHELDFIGVSSYFAISDNKDPSYNSLLENWKLVKRYILYHQHEVFQKPIVLTEVGYTSQDGTSTEPWNYAISSELDLLEQKECYQAFSETWKKEPLFCGVLFYDWFGTGGAEDLGYTFRDKLAMKVVEEWFD